MPIYTEKSGNNLKMLWWKHWHIKSVHLMSIEGRNKWTTRAGRSYVVIVGWNDEGQESRKTSIYVHQGQITNVWHRTVGHWRSNKVSPPLMVRRVAQCNSSWKKATIHNLTLAWTGLKIASILFAYSKKLGRAEGLMRYGIPDIPFLESLKT